MDKSKYTITLDYNKAIKQADELGSISAELINLAEKKYEQSIRKLSGSWKGDNAEAYISKAEQLKKQMLETARKLNNASEAVRTIAKNTYDTEMRALEIAEKRTYGG